MLDLLLIPSLLTLSYSLILIFYPIKISNISGSFFCFFVFLVCIFYIGFRGEYGTDYESYNYLFLGKANTEQFGIIFQAISNLIQSIFFWDDNLKPIIGFLIIFIIYIFFLFKLAAKFAEIKYFVFLYLFSIMIFPNLLGSVRQGISMIISFYAIILIIEKQTLKSFSYSFFAANIHLGGSFGLLISLFTRNFYVLLPIFFIIFYFAGSFYYEFIFNKLLHYYGFSLPNSSLRVIDLGKIIFFPFVIYAIWKYFGLPSLLVVIFFMTTILSRVFFGDVFDEIVSRMGPYFEVYKLILLKIFLEKKDWLILQIFMFLMALSIFPKIISHLGRWDYFFNLHFF